MNKKSTVDNSIPLSWRLCLGSDALTDEQKTALDGTLTRQFNHAGKPAPLSPTLACIDYSIAKLVAYRWSGEKTLSQRNYVW